MSTPSRHGATGRVGRPARRGVVVLPLLAGAIGLGSSPALASGAPAAETSVRAAHLVPGLEGMDFVATPLDGGEPVELADAAGYGTVGGYEDVPAGEYRVDVRPTGSDEADAPALSGTFDLAPGAATTLAGLGTLDQPRLATLADERTAPEDGSARVRLVNAAQGTPLVDVAAVDGPVIAQGAVFGQATAYSDVPAGDWDLRVNAGGAVSAATATLDAETVYTVFLLGQDGDAPSLLPVVDATGTTGVAPAVGVAAPAEGAGATSTPVPGDGDGSTAAEGAAGMAVVPSGGADTGVGGASSGLSDALLLTGGALLVIGGSAGTVTSARRRRADAG
ncbi:DUF4397 domain-containing protein [uncultured Pseudokineococcus sp.]|uniref:DUF4397 domain-containing protein n=1 Tax=uncultured Pseudokineococcus sp. TaxID=1642928 RepID=UPI002628D173|nr:DUF4397 domain-containing protein [uncultured Pseudokineococcus sp.]